MSIQADTLKAPFPAFGGKSAVAPLIWELNDRAGPKPIGLDPGAILADWIKGLAPGGRAAPAPEGARSAERRAAGSTEAYRGLHCSAAFPPIMLTFEGF